MKRIQFLIFDGCPLADAAQAALEQALKICGLSTQQYEAIDILDPGTPENLARWGSPTILVDGRDVTGHTQGDAIGCRLYDTKDQVPSVESIASAIRSGGAT